MLSINHQKRRGSLVICLRHCYKVGRGKKICPQGKLYTIFIVLNLFFWLQNFLCCIQKMRRWRQTERERQQSYLSRRKNWLSKFHWGLGIDHSRATHMYNTAQRNWHALSGSLSDSRIHNIRLFSCHPDCLGASQSL